MPRRRWWHLDPGGAVLGLALAALSITPSLLPRPALLQGALAAVGFGVGYLVGVAVWALVRRIAPWRPRPATQRILWAVYGLIWLVSVAVLSVLAVVWQNEVRTLVEMPPLEGSAVPLFAAGFLPVTALLLAIGKGVRRLSTALARRVGPVAGGIGSTTVVVAGLAALTLVVTLAVDAVYFERNAAADPAVIEPRSDFRSAGAESAVAWETLGRHGAAFVGGGPTAAEITDVTGIPALEPIRVYAGLESAPTTAERATLVVDELVRTGGFSRDVLVLATATGSGWLEPQTIDAIEYLHAGSTAIAAMQYAYTPSWVSFVFDPDAPVEAARALFDAVYAHWITLPKADRPQLISYGLSLGAHGSQALFADVDAIRSQTSGAMFVGSPNGSPLWRSLQAARDAGSPPWQPVLEGGREVRWMSRPGGVEQPTAVWSLPRVVYLQHASDPVTWLDPALLWSAPDWLEPESRGPDLSPAMRWIPVVTATQVVVDMLMGEAVPARHGHNYGDVVTEAWRAVTRDAGLDAAALARVEATIEAYADIRPFAD